jgi:methylated-DNA-protein-cysteine methyltransferase-like protein
MDFHGCNGKCSVRNGNLQRGVASGEAVWTRNEESDAALVKIGYVEIYDVVARIPRRRVATYGQIAELAGIPRQARRIGYALSALSGDSGIPWHRVINAKGMISSRSINGPDKLQRRLLKREGIVFDASGRIDLTRFQWRPRE